MKSRFTFFFLLIATISFGQKITLESLTSEIEKIAKEDNIVGLTIGITTKDSVIYNKGFGYSDKEKLQEVTPQTHFRMGSIAKMFISMSIMQLVEKGKLSLDDEVKNIVPEIKFQNNWASKAPLKVIHLLEHTSGFDDIKLNRFSTYSNDLNSGIEEVQAQLPSMICRWQPGERMAYSNPNYALLGYIIEKLSGQLYPAYIKANIFKPLEMTTSNFNLNCQNPNIETKEYAFEKGTIKSVACSNCLSGASGALWSSSSELLKFVQVFLEPDSTLITPVSLQKIETSHSSLAAKNGQKFGYGLGNSIAFLNKKIPFRGHDGLLNACFSGLYYNRDLGLGFVVANNSNRPNWRIYDVILDYLTQEIEAKKLEEFPLDKKAIKPFLGQYQFGSPRVQLSAFANKLERTPTIFIKDEHLYYQPLFGQASQLIQVGELQFTWKDMNVPFVTFTQNTTGENVMMIGGDYYEQSTSIWIKLRLGIFVIAILFLLSSIILFITASIQRVLKRINSQQLIIRSFPLIGLLFLIIGVFALNEIQAFTYKMAELSTVSSRSVTIFIGTLGFGIFSFLTLILAIKNFKAQSKHFKYYFLAIACSMTFLTIFLITNGWIGMRTWAM